MIGFKDMTFCSSQTCENAACERNWRLRDKSDYMAWSKNFKDGNGPVTFAGFESDCDEYMTSGDAA